MLEPSSRYDEAERHAREQEPFESARKLRGIERDAGLAEHCSAGSGERELVLELLTADEKTGIGEVHAAHEGKHKDSVSLVALNDCLESLSRANPRHAQVVELRLFSGFSIQETAEALELSPRSIDSDWAMAKASLRRHLT